MIEHEHYSRTDRSATIRTLMTISREHEPIPMSTEFGPIGQDNYSEMAARLVSEGLRDGSVNADDRKEMWKNFLKLESAIADRLKENGGKENEVIGILEEEIWKHRLASGSAKESDFRTFRSRKLAEQSKPNAKVQNLDDHHASVELYSRKLLERLQLAAQETGKKTPLSAEQMQLIPEMMRVHDILKWLAKFGSKDSIAADHEEQMRYVVRKHFVGQTMAGIVITPELADWMAEALGEHENIYDEDNWSLQRAKEDLHGETISFEFLMDTMTNAIDVEKDASGQWNVTLNPEEFARFIDLAERHINLFVPGEANTSGVKNFEIAKAYRPEWILKASLDFIKILQSWERNYGVHTPTEAIATIFAQCYGVLEKASIALEGYSSVSSKQLKIIQIDACKRALKERQSELIGKETTSFTAIEDSVLSGVMEDTLNDKEALRAIAIGNGKAYAEATGRDSKASVLQASEIALLQRGQEFSTISDFDRSVEMIGNNSVGFIQLIRLLALMENGQDEAVVKLSFAQKLDLLANQTSTINDMWLEVGSRGSHAGWLLSVNVTAKERKARMLAFDHRDKILASSDWLQIKNAASFVLRHPEIQSLEECMQRYHDRAFMVECAKECNNEYVKNQLDYYKSIGKNPPAWLSENMLTPEQEERLKTGSSYGFDPENEYDRTRIKYGENILGFLALQEEIATLARLRRRPAREILNAIIQGTLAPADRSFLTSAQKALYLQMQVYKGTYAESRIDVTSIQSKLQVESIEDWRQVKDAAVVMLAQLAEQASPEVEIDLSLEKTQNRPTRIIEQDATEEELITTLEELGIQKADHVLMFSGGAVFMEGGVNLDEFKSTLTNTIKAMIERGEKVLIVTGGTDSGFMHIAGEIAERIYRESPKAKMYLQVLGISPKDLVTFDTNPPEGRYTVATGHTHHLWVDKAAVSGTGARIDLPDTFGDETSVIRRVLAHCGKDTLGNEFIVGNGGVGTALEVRADLEIGFPLHFIKDSYRMAALVGVVLEANTYQDYRDLLTTRMSPVAGEPNDVTKQKQKTLKEIDNIFAILKGSDSGIDTRVSDNLEKVPVASETNYQRVRALLLGSPSGVKYVSVSELDQDLAKMKRSVADLTRERLATKDPVQRDFLENLLFEAQRRIRALRN